MIALLSDLRVRVGACVLAMGVLGGLAAVTSAKPPTPQADGSEEATRTVVNRTALACPVPGAGAKTQSSVSAVAPVLPDGTPTAEGTEQPLSMSPLDPTSNPVGSVLARGRIASTAPTSKLLPLTVRGTGPLAAGTVATSTTSAPEGVNRGMASVPCQVPGSNFWFVGASGAPGRRDVLVLTNLDSVNAEVNVTLYGADGQLDTPNARGVVVPARGTSEIYLGQIARGQRDLALHVESTGGRVAPAVRDNATTGKVPAGIDWLNLSAPPASKVVVPAMAPGGGVRILTIANPTDLQATATLTVNGPNGPFKPAGLSTVQVPAGSVKVVRLEKVLLGNASAVTVNSDQPVTAAVRMTDSSVREFATMGATEPLRGPAYLVLPAHAQPAVLQVTAPGETAGVRFELRDGANKVLQARKLDVVGGATNLITFKAQARPTYLMVEQLRGDIVAGVTLMPAAKPKDDDVPQVAAWPLTTSLVFRAQLGAQSDVAAALR
ncbi:hypothetical protein Kfla_1591 [Kribbella flavida DSM 17836]|uniref:Secreted protein n=1 Tax=Kribbella flavida (strain DSM 17836 / JCM 10339 / NBRC 14399) TaxID=479435 RepID=D2PME3_KRIFD|nr:DUF5719 family protein [Kribbella flavida]ADB30687.1 hypothetical protein Kfla_1591 [Kribbella flavida DSM 17836]